MTASLLCPASPVKSEENGSDTGLQSLLLALVDSQILLAARIEAQTEAINNLAESNFALVQAMAESCGDEMPPTTYMDGSPIR